MAAFSITVPITHHQLQPWYVVVASRYICGIKMTIYTGGSPI